MCACLERFDSASSFSSAARTTSPAVRASTSLTAASERFFLTSCPKFVALVVKTEFGNPAASATPALYAAPAESLFCFCCSAKSYQIRPSNGNLAIPS